MKTIQTKVIDLNLGGQSAGTDQNRHPRHVVHFQGCILAYGGDTGVLTAISLSSLRKEDGEEKAPARVIARFDDPIRAVAISPDHGQRIAFGFDDGSTRIYSFPSTTTTIHPLLKNILEHSDMEEDTTFFSQCDGADESSTFIPGPRLEAPIRCMAFHPLSCPNRGYYLAVASEASPGFVILRIPNHTSSSGGTTLTSEEEEDFKTYLREEGGEAHDMSGLRTLCFSPTSSSVGGGSASSQPTILSTLSMDGRMCLWNVNTLEDPGFLWELLHRDAFKVVRKPDVGEWNGSVVADRIYAPVWADGFTSPDSKEESLLVLGLPGACDVQCRIQSKTGKGWEKKSYWLTTTSSEGHSDDIVTLAFEPMSSEELRREKSRLLVTSGRDGNVCVWEVYNQVPVFKTDIDKDDATPQQDIGRFIQRIQMDDSSNSSSNLFTKIMWFMDEDGEKFLCLATDDGTMKCLIGKQQLNQLRQATVAKVDSTSTDAKKDTEVLEESSHHNHSTKRIKKMKPEVDDDSTISAETFGHESLFDAQSIKEKNTVQGRNAFVDDEADEGPDDDISYDDVLRQDDAPQSDEVDAKQDKDELDDVDFPNNDESVDDPITQRGKTFSPIPEAQAAFAPSSTPLGFKRRILCWNYKGTITTRADDTGRSTIDISFTDAISSRPVSFRDNMDFIIGSLGDDGAIFSSDLMEDDFVDDDMRNTFDELAFLSDVSKSNLKRSGRSKRIGGNNEAFTGSCIFFYRFETFGSAKDKDWQISLPTGERAVGCACGEGWAAVVTNRRFLRMFTSSGLQGPVIWLKGDPVVMVGRGRFLSVICHEANPLMDGTQKLAYTIYDAVNYKLIASGSVAAISSCGSLTWAGFSSDFSLIIKDSEGLLSMLSCNDPDQGSNWLWTPILDTNSHKKAWDDVFWPVTVENGKLTTLHLRGGDKHPDPIRRPITICLDLFLPLVGSLSDSAFKLEEISVRASVALNQKRAIDLLVGSGDGVEVEDSEAAYAAMSAKVDKVILKMFFQFLETSKIERAFDATKRLNLEASYDIAVTAADRMGLRKLSDRIIAFKELKFPVQDEPLDEIDEERAYSSFPTHHNEQRQVSPEMYAAPKSLKRKDNDFDDDLNVDSQKGRSVKVKADAQSDHYPDDTANEKKKRFFNPFAKKTVESPAKAPSSPSRKSPIRKPQLSRNATFSAEARKMSKISKKIL